LVRDRTTVPIGGPHQRAILAFLALNAGSTVVASRLIDAVWGDRAPASVAKSLTTLISRVRHATNGSGISIDHTGVGYCCDLPADALDVKVFERACDEAASDLSVGNASLAVRRWRAALELWRGDAMEDIGEFPFVQHARDALVARRVAAENSLVTALVQVGDLGGAIELSRRLVEATPFDEHRWAALVRVLASAGRQREALETYRRVRTLLRDELGIEPSHELRRAERDVLDQLQRAPRRSHSGGPFIGRAVALDVMRNAVDSLARGEPRVLAIDGEPGIGKTALATEFARRSELDGVLVLDVSCARSDTIPLGAYARALRGLQFSGPGQPVARAAIESWPLGDDTAPSDDQWWYHRQRLSHWAEESATNLAQRAPLAIVLDNAQWADDLTLGVMQALATASSVPVLLVVLMRSDDQGADSAKQLLRDISTFVPVDYITLEPFSRDEIVALVHALGCSSDEPELIDPIMHASGGNPLYATQFALLIHATTGTLPSALPKTLETVLRGRVADLSSPCRQLLEFASVLDDEFSSELLSLVTGRPVLDIAADIDEARRAGVVRVGSAGDRYTFAHGLIRQAVYDGLGEALQSSLHRTVARALPSNDPQYEMARALHLRSVLPQCDVREYVPAALAGARAATRVAAFDTAVTLLRSVLDLAAPGTTETCEAKLRLGEVLIAQGRRAEGDQHLADAVAMAERSSRWDLVADGLLVAPRRGISPSTNDARAKAAEVSRVLEHVSPADVERRAALLCWLANLLVNVEPHAAGEALDEAEGLIGAGDGATAIAARFDVELTRLRQCESRGGEPNAAAARARELREAAAASGSLGIAATAGAFVLAARLRAGDTAWRDDEQRARHFAELSGHVEVDILVDGIDAARALLTRPVPDADAISRAAERRGYRHGSITSAGLRVLQSFVIRREQLRLHEVEPFLALGHESGRVGLEGLLATCRLEAGDQAGARVLLERFVSEVLPTLQRDWVHDAAIAVAADACFELDLAAGADMMRERLAPVAGQVIVMASACLVVGRADRYLGQLAALAGDDAAALAHFARARVLDGDGPYRLWEGWAFHDEAKVRARAGAAAGADGQLRAVQSLRQRAAEAACWSGSERLTAAVGALGGI
jgi:DNA-binding SARP family transcriptional activator